MLCRHCRLVNGMSLVTTVIVPFKLGPGAMGWTGSNVFLGSTIANRTAANPATRNWGMTMKMLWIPFGDKRNEDEKRTTNHWKREGRLTRIIPAFELNVDETALSLRLTPLALPLVSCPPNMNSYSSF
jgi:hypothetical protein